MISRKSKWIIKFQINLIITTKQSNLHLNPKDKVSQSSLKNNLLIATSQTEASLIQLRQGWKDFLCGILSTMIVMTSHLISNWAMEKFQLFTNDLFFN